MASRRRTTRVVRRQSSRRDVFTSSHVGALLAVVILVGSVGLVALNWEVEPSGNYFAVAGRIAEVPATCGRCLDDFTGFSCADLQEGDNNFETLSTACETAYTSCASVRVCPLLSCGNAVCNLEEGENAQNCAVDCA